jgi:hypothetical protein
MVQVIPSPANAVLKLRCSRDSRDLRFLNCTLGDRYSVTSSWHSRPMVPAFPTRGRRWKRSSAPKAHQMSTGAAMCSIEFLARKPQRRAANTKTSFIDVAELTLSGRCRFHMTLAERDSLRVKLSNCEIELNKYKDLETHLKVANPLLSLGVRAKLSFLAVTQDKVHVRGLIWYE